MKPFIKFLKDSLGILFILTGLVFFVLVLLYTLPTRQFQGREATINWGFISTVIGLIILGLFIICISILKNNVIIKRPLYNFSKHAHMSTNDTRAKESEAQHNNLGASPDLNLTEKSLGKVLEILEISQHLVQRETLMYKPKTYNQNVALILYNLGTALRDMHKYEEALKFYHASLKIRKELALEGYHVYEKYVADTINNIGITLCKMKRYDGALHEYKKAYKLYYKLSAEKPTIYDQYVAMVLINMSRFYFKEMKNQKESERYAKKAISIMQKHRNLPSYSKFINEAQHILNQCEKENEVI